jgi:arylsulfatase A-like enzyme/Flp pilus assembly protein TadD
MSFCFSIVRGFVCAGCLITSALLAQNAPVATPSSSVILPGTGAPNIILITIDTTRADRMGFLGSQRGLTPSLDTLAHDSVVFAHAYSQAPLTAPSHATILTGTYPQFHRVSDFQLPLSKDLPFAPAILKAKGYKTAAFVGSLVLDPSVDLAVGFNRGFDTYDAGFHMSARGEDRYKSVERRGAVVVDHALAWLKQNPQGPFFVWVHLYDAHEPYDPPEPFKTKYASALYDGEIAYVDSAVGTLLTELHNRGLYDNSMIALMADHGESLGAHGEDTHGFFLYDETIHVPLLFKLPAGKSAGVQIDKFVGLVDVLPTILQTVGIAIPKEMQGSPLLGTAPPDRPLYAETDYGRSAFGWSSLRSLRTGKYLFVEAPRRELYDRTADPKEGNNLALASKAVADTLQSRLDDFREKTSSSGEAPKRVADPEAAAKLVALGYMGAGSGVSSANGSQITGADPKDKIQIGNMVSQANFLLEDWRFEEAIPLLKQIIAKEPDMEMLYKKLGMAELVMGNAAEAVQPFRKVIEFSPDRPDGYFNLGNALLRSQDYQGAVAAYKILAVKDPSFWEAHMMLAMSYSRMNDLPQAIRECHTVLAVAPEHYGTNLILGRVLLRSGNAESAVASLQKAASLRPKSTEPHVALADAYTKLGREADAVHEREEVQRLQSTPTPLAPDPMQ